MVEYCDIITGNHYSMKKGLQLYLALVLVLDLGDQTVQLGTHSIGCGSTAGTLEVLLEATQ